MKNYNQVYVKNSFEAAKMYCKAFGAEITREFINEQNTAYEHCELSVNGEGTGTYDRYHPQLGNEWTAYCKAKEERLSGV